MRFTNNQVVAVLEGGYDVDLIKDHCIGVITQMTQLEPKEYEIVSSSEVNPVGLEAY